MKSLRGQLLFFWVLLFGMCAALAVVMVTLYRSSAGAQVAVGRGATEQSCRAIAARYARSTTAPAPAQPQVDLLQVLLQLVLIEAPHVEGGVWQAAGGQLAYAYPTYEGSGVKRDVPSAEQPLIAELAQLAARTQQPQTDVVRGNREALIVSACPLAAPGKDLAAWTMTRTNGGALAAQDSLRTGLGVLLLLVLASGLWLGFILLRGLRHVQRLENRLAQAQADTDGSAVPELPRTGVRELDRIVDGFNHYRLRFEEARAHLRATAQQRSRDQRLAALGRMTGGIAHEIRNPIATMRLKAENALAAAPERQGAALQAIVGQIDRLDGLVQSLLALVQPVTLAPADVVLHRWLDERVAAVAPKAHAAGVQVTLQHETPASALFDPVHLARAVDNLLDNAVRHAPRGGHVVLSALQPDVHTLSIRVDDDGPGVPETLQASLFEPFATGRADGTGLGLALAREVALAHGGELHHVPLAPGTRFELELPWRIS
ncbi:sensor histidine kinase [Variovorax boronicumulans]|uniref:sensor histidine kinase n=1 Tax=Variovorax boronicumulans TaxID=436515 RepID=UPI002474802D|nr:HAMP domain-containing sensor histidine kinase [Variovorax boronicumulans]